MTQPALADRRGREGQTFRGGSRLVRYANFVKLPHTLFALPFALVGATLATYVRPATPARLGWIVVAFSAARFAAMGFNRIVDRFIDARNPRTAARELPSGQITLGEAWRAVILAAAVFIVSASRLGALCVALAPLALAWVSFYSFTKRFTRWSHLVLGLGLAIAPVGGYLAIAGDWSRPWWTLCVLAMAVATWVGGFDVLYALQDTEFDRANALHSVPAAHGERAAFVIARVLHGATVLSLVLLGLAVGGRTLYWSGVVAAAMLLLYEHSLVGPGDLRRLDAAFFTMNGVISIVFAAFVVAERLAAHAPPALVAEVRSRLP